MKWRVEIEIEKGTQVSGYDADNVYEMVKRLSDLDPAPVEIETLFEVERIAIFHIVAPSNAKAAAIAARLAKEIEEFDTQLPWTATPQTPELIENVS